MSYTVSSEKSQLDIDLIHDFLRNDSYWAKNIPRDVLVRSIENSLCFGAYLDGKQVGFARVVTDFAVFAYLADVFVVKEHRGRGVSKRIMEAVLAHPQLQGLRRWNLVTTDAHALYRQFGFAPIAEPQKHMEIVKKNAYGDSPQGSGLTAQ